MEGDSQNGSASVPPVLVAPPPLLMSPQSGGESDAAPARPWGFWWTVAFGSCIVGAYILVQSLVVLVAAFLQGQLTNPQAIEAVAYNGDVLSICIVVSLPVALGLCVLFAWMRRGVGVADYLGLRRCSWKTTLLGLICVVALGLSYDSISTLLGRVEAPEFMLKVYRTAMYPPLLWIAIVGGAPLSEEIFFRGFLFKGLEASPVGAAGAILLTAMGWAVIHLQYELFDILFIFLLGILLGVARWWSGSIVPPLLMHMLQNLVATVQVAHLTD
jgi:membrane protease YdiL (CAAX protease family)